MAEDADMKQEGLGERMKRYEHQWETTLSSDLPWVARLDGHAFSKFTRGLQKPFDNRFAKAMVKTADDLLQEFRASLAYTQSDEITLTFFPVVHDDGVIQAIPWKGRVQKIATLMASFASIRFTQYIREMALSKVDDSPSKQVLVGSEIFPIRGYPSAEELLSDASCERLVSGRASYFDCRIFQVPNEQEAMHAVYWRNKYDCKRNAVSKAARSFYSSKQLMNKNTDEQIAMMAEKGFSFDAQIHPVIINGAFVKRETYSKVSEHGEALRTRSVVFSCAMDNLSDEARRLAFIDLFKAKHLEEKHRQFLAQL